MHLTSPKGLKDPIAVAARTALLGTAPSAQPLREWTRDLIDERVAHHPEILIPHFDPAEAGVDARVLVVMEAPGPMTNTGNRRPGSGFISVDNNDETAKNCWTLRDEVGLDETRTLHWNIVPWYLGPASTKPKARELAEGAHALQSLLTILPNVEVIIVCGRIAEKGWREHVAPNAPLHGTTVIETWHPSPLSINHPGRRDELRRAFARAERLTSD